jgi:hypothetical protein
LPLLANAHDDVIKGRGRRKKENFSFVLRWLFHLFVLPSQTTFICIAVKDIEWRRRWHLKRTTQRGKTFIAKLKMGISAAFEYETAHVERGQFVRKERERERERDLPVLVKEKCGSFFAKSH